MLIVLGNEPLDDQTPTVDTMTRVKTAVDFWGKHENSTIIIFSGGPTAGKMTEAKMMANYAASLGVPSDVMRLEEKARSTGENAQLSAVLLWKEKIVPKNIYIVSKSDHLQWAMPIFKNHKGPIASFKTALPLGCSVTKEESIAQMTKYLEQHTENSPATQRVRWRKKNLEKGIQGID